MPEAQIEPVIKWFHQVLGHPGENRLRETIIMRYYHPDLRRNIDNFVCDTCKRYKLSGRGFGFLPGRDVNIHLWHEVAVDLIGSWSIEIIDKWYKFNSLTSIYLVTNIVDLIRVDRNTSAQIRSKWKQSWPRIYIHDNGEEFNCWEFQDLLRAASIKDVPTTSWNPQANASFERMHQTVGNILRVILYTNPPRTVANAADLIDQAIATAMHSMKVNVTSTIKVSPGSLVFGIDIILDIPLIAYWKMIQHDRQTLVNERLYQANEGRRRFDYIQWQRLLKKKDRPDKLGELTEGPYQITRVHTNVTVSIDLCPNVTE